MYSQFAALTALALVFSGCVTASNTLPLEQVANLRVASVNVGFARDARIAWADEKAPMPRPRVCRLTSPARLRGLQTLKPTFATLWDPK
jgi:hypothetical protein